MLIWSWMVPICYWQCQVWYHLIEKGTYSSFPCVNLVGTSVRIMSDRAAIPEIATQSPIACFQVCDGRLVRVQAECPDDHLHAIDSAICLPVCEDTGWGEPFHVVFFGPVNGGRDVEIIVWNFII